ncbi:gag-protease polyprotein [Cucumis melo var. makuwa]|uniref:Gag-protease polyprotein n=2 Tax=Cucumis melo TaxID=3656 RepID=A0A5D3D6A7_CUCMM|nr:gag-protease polyprotein [Cucumis melo var. makuwa]TYK19065.1 gag-protease polyprotein [Cucumis melo var. makuwa]
MGSFTLMTMCSFGFTKDWLVPTRSQIARIRERASSQTEAEVRAKASWRMTRSDRGKMPPCRGAHRGGGRRGRGAGRIQHEEQPAVQAANLTAFTHVALAQTQVASAQALMVPQIVSDQLSAEAKHLRDFRKYNPKTFDESMDNPTKAQMWLTSIEKFCRYMKCPNDQKVQCVVFFLEDRGDRTVEQYDAEFDMLSRFAPDVVKDEEARTEKFVRGLRLDLQGIVQALRPTTHADALHLALDLSLHERADPSKAAGRGSTLGQKRKVESQIAVAPQRNLRSGGVFQRYRQELVAAGRTLRELPVCRRCGRAHGGRFLIGSGVCFKCKQPGHTADACPQKLIETTPHQPPASQQGRVFAITRQEVERAGTMVTVFVRQMDLEVEPLGSILSVSTPLGEVMLSKDKIKACQVEPCFASLQPVFPPPFNPCFCLPSTRIYVSLQTVSIFFLHFRQYSSFTFALLNLSLHESNKVIITNAGAVKSLVYVLKIGTKTSKQNAACALMSLALLEENKTSIGVCGGIPPLVSLLLNGSNRRKKDALTTLYKLCLIKPNNEQAITARAVKPLVALVAEQGTSLAEKAMVVLSNLAGIQEGKDTIVEEGGIAALVEAIEDELVKGKEFAVLTLL